MPRRLLTSDLDAAERGLAAALLLPFVALAATQDGTWEPKCESSTSDQCYLPPGTFRPVVAVQKDGGGGPSRVYENSASWLLHAIDEPRLWKSSSSHTVVRCTIRPTWEHALVLRVVENRNGRFDATLIQLAGQGGFDAPKVDAKAFGWVSPSAVRDFVAGIEKANKAPDPTQVVIDGDLYVAEILVSTHYLSVSEVDGAQGKEGVGVFAACQNLLKQMRTD
jgi:hypothetical protein